jgi:hypothetical protein
MAFAHFITVNGKRVPVSVKTYNNVVTSMQFKRKPVGPSIKS